LLKRRSTREERKPVIRNDDDDNRTLNRFPTKDCHARNITHHNESVTS
jgi:hypothetical protein